MTALFTRRPRLGSDPIERKRLTSLGKVRGAEYVTHDGREFALVGSTVDTPEDLAAPDDALIVSVPVVVEDRGRELPIGAKFRAALPVPSGTYAALAAERNAKAHPPPMPADALALPCLNRGSSWMGSQTRRSGSIRGRDLLDWFEAEAFGSSRTPAGSCPSTRADGCPPIRHSCSNGHRD